MAATVRIQTARKPPQPRKSACLLTAVRCEVWHRLWPTPMVRLVQQHRLLLVTTMLKSCLTTMLKRHASLQVPQIRFSRTSSRGVQARCIHCLRTNLLQPRFNEREARSTSAVLLVQQLSCSRKVRKDILGSAHQPRTGNTESNETEPSDSQQHGTCTDVESTGTTPTEDSAGVKFALSILQFYKREISPILPPSCRFLPTCSEYSMDSFKRYGVGKGVVLTAWRLLRCNPFGVLLLQWRNGQLDSLPANAQYPDTGVRKGRTPVSGLFAHKEQG